MSTIRCDVLLFAALAEVAGAASIAVELPEGSTAGDVWLALERRAPTTAGGIAAWRHRVVVAVNERYVGPSTALRDGDRVALIPPVSGG